MSYTFMDNSMMSWSLALAVMLLSLGLIYLVKHVVVRRLAAMAVRSATYLDDVAVSILSATNPIVILLLSTYIGSQWLTLPPRVTATLNHCAIIALLLQLAIWGDTGVRAWLASYRERRSGADAASTTSTAAIGFIARAALWLIIALMVLDNLGVNITTLIASLGIGGIAVALALQNILGDLFSSLSIVLDKPFVVGDFIIVDDAMGTVEYVGLKTTRIRSLGGEQIVFSNSDLLKSRIRNYKRMQTRRIAFSIGVTYQTTETQLRLIPAVVREIIAAQPHAQFDRAHFQGFGPSSLDFEIVYNVSSPHYGVYMDIQQAINLALFARFAAESIEFAYPTQTIHLVEPRLAPQAGSVGGGRTAGAAQAGQLAQSSPLP